MKIETAPAPLKLLVAEYDPEVAAWYLTTRRGKVAKTVPMPHPRALVNFDFDATGNVLGIEVIGVKKFAVGELAAGTVQIFTTGEEMPFGTRLLFSAKA